MRRRELIKLLGGAAAALPLAARAGPTAMPVVGFLDPRSSPDSFSNDIAGFHQGLKDIGFVENENVAIEYAWSHDQFDRLPTLAADLVSRPVDVLVASGGSQVAVVAKAATTTIPVVFAVAHDPIGLGLVVSLARPGGNATGVNSFNAEPYAKRLELLDRLLPRGARMAVLVNPADDATMQATLREVGSAAGYLGLETMTFNASSSQEIDAALLGCRPMAGRALVKQLLREILVIDDTYNANPSSMLGAIAMAKLGLTPLELKQQQKC